MSGSFSFKVYVNLGYTAHTQLQGITWKVINHLKQLHLRQMCELSFHSLTRWHQRWQKPAYNCVAEISGKALWGEGKVTSISVQLHSQMYLAVALHVQVSSNVPTELGVQTVGEQAMRRGVEKKEM